MTLPIAKLPAAVLRRPVTDITFPLSKEVKKLMKDMLNTVKYANGVGLAATQVSQSYNMALIYLAEMEVPPFFIFNPTITKQSSEQTTMEEGCLSIPGIFGKVTRPKKITLTAQNSDGKKITITDDTFLARVLQHEIDHLNNELILDKFDEITSGKDLIDQYKE